MAFVNAARTMHQAWVGRREAAKSPGLQGGTWDLDPRIFLKSNVSGRCQRHEPYPRLKMIPQKVSPGPKPEQTHCVQHLDTFSCVSFQEQKSGSGSRSSSPKPCPLSRPPLGRTGVAMMMPSVIQIETAFRRVAVENTQTLTVRTLNDTFFSRNVPCCCCCCNLDC